MAKNSQKVSRSSSKQSVNSNGNKKSILGSLIDSIKRLFGAEQDSGKTNDVTSDNSNGQRVVMQQDEDFEREREASRRAGRNVEPVRYVEVRQAEPRVTGNTAELRGKSNTDDLRSKIAEMTAALEAEEGLGGASEKDMPKDTMLKDKPNDIKNADKQQNVAGINSSSVNGKNNAEGLQQGPVKAVNNKKNNVNNGVQGVGNKDINNRKDKKKLNPFKSIGKDKNGNRKKDLQNKARNSRPVMKKANSNSNKSKVSFKK